MPTSTLTRYNKVHPYMPLRSQQNAGSNMSIIFFTYLQSLKELPSSKKQQIKSLNIKTIAEILFPLPTWTASLEY